MTTQNSQLQVFRGSWNEDLENTFFDVNRDGLPTASVESFFIQSDGSNIFMVRGSARIDRFLLTAPWRMELFEVIQQDRFTITEDATPTGLFFKDDGTKMFVVGQTTKTIYEYTVVIPWTPSSIVDSPVSLSLSVVTNDVDQCAFSRDGDFFYITDGVSVYGFPLPTPWDVTSNVSNVSFTPPSGDNVDSVTFKREGDKMYLGDATAGIITEYDLSTVNDVTTAIANGNTLVSGIPPHDIFFKPTGLEFFIGDVAVGASLIKFHLDTAWNIQTASHFLNSVDVPSDNNRGMAFKPDGLKMYLAERDNDVIREFSMTAPWNINTATAGSTFDILSIESSVSNLWWKPDGTRLYIIGTSNSTVIQLNASTPYDVSTLSDPAISFSPAIGSLLGLFFRDDGNKMYLSATDDTVREYDLTNWDITTLVEVGNKDFTPVGPSIQAIFFKFDGTQLFSMSFSTRLITRTTLTTPWDIESAVFDTTDAFSTAPNVASPLSMFVRYDAEKIFVGGLVDTVFSYDLLQEFNKSLITDFGDELVTDLGDQLVFA